MTYLTVKVIKGNPYLYEVRSERDGDKVRQVFVRYLGRADKQGKVEHGVVKTPSVEPEIKISRQGSVLGEGLDAVSVRQLESGKYQVTPSYNQQSQGATRQLFDTEEEALKAVEPAMIEPEAITTEAVTTPVIEEPYVYLPDRVSPSGGYVKKPAVFIRFGRIPEGGKSAQYGADGEITKYEKGVSVYKAWFDDKTGKYIIENPDAESIGTQESLIDEASRGKKKAYLVSGEEMRDTGGDDESLLQPDSAKIIKEITLDDLVPADDAYYTFAGTELTEEQYPAWESTPTPPVTPEPEKAIELEPTPLKEMTPRKLKDKEETLKSAMLKYAPQLEQDYKTSVRNTFENMKKDLGENLQGVYNNPTWARTFMELRTSVKQDSPEGVYSYSQLQKYPYIIDEDKLEQNAKRYGEETALAWYNKMKDKLVNIENVDVSEPDLGGFVTIDGTIDDKKVRIEQQRIFKTSQYGTPFHQFPARIYVGDKFYSEADYKKQFHDIDVDKVKAEAIEKRPKIDPNTRPKSFYFKFTITRSDGTTYEDRRDAKGMTEAEALEKLKKREMKYGKEYGFQVSDFRTDAIYAWNHRPIWKASSGEPKPKEGIIEPSPTL